MELCWKLGCVHPDKLDTTLNQAQLADWIAWLSMEPRGYRRDDARSALQTMYIRQALVEESVEPSQFMLQFSDAIVFDNPETESLVKDFLAPQPLIGF